MINSEKGLQMSQSVVIFLSPYCDAMAAIVLTAIARSPMHFREKAYVRGYMSVPIAKGNLL